jgi:hypothetical protein
LPPRGCDALAREVSAGKFFLRHLPNTQVNERLFHHQLQACQFAPDAATLQRVVLPSVEDGLQATACASATMTLLACLYSLVVQGSGGKRRVYWKIEH